MQKNYTSLGLMSGTSGDGVDASIIYSNGLDKFEAIKDKFFEYDSKIYKKIHSIKEKIFDENDLKKLESELNALEREITLFHAKIITEFDSLSKSFVVGFHGQTIYHSSKKKISKQLGNAELLSQLTKKKIVYNFRENDLRNGGEGAPLTPIFHQLIANQKKMDLPVSFMNIGGISNITIVKKKDGSNELFSKDIGPGNCLIDSWVRKNSKNKFDKDGLLASIGKKNEIILEQAQELFMNRLNKKKNSYDINDFDISFARGLTLEDGVATLTDFTANILGEALYSIFQKDSNVQKILVCGGGRKNQILLNNIINKSPPNLIFELIDKYMIDGDFVESQAFAFIAIRTLNNLPITFPSTTNCKKPTVGGKILEN